jgi:hypothetical protein
MPSLPTLLHQAQSTPRSVHHPPKGRASTSAIHFAVPNFGTLLVVGALHLLPFAEMFPVILPSAPLTFNLLHYRAPDRLRRNRVETRLAPSRPPLSSLFEPAAPSPRDDHTAGTSQHAFRLWTILLTFLSLHTSQLHLVVRSPTSPRLFLPRRSPRAEPLRVDDATLRHDMVHYHEHELPPYLNDLPPGTNPFLASDQYWDERVWPTPSPGFKIRLIILGILLGVMLCASLGNIAVIAVAARRRGERLWAVRLVPRENGR